MFNKRVHLLVLMLSKCTVQQ